MKIGSGITSIFARAFYAPKIISFLQGRIPENALKTIRKYVPLLFMQVAIIDAHGNVLVVLRKRDKGVGFQTNDGQDFYLLIGKHRRAGRWSGQTAKVILREKLTLDFDPHCFHFLPMPYEIVFHDSEKQEYMHAIIQVAIIQIDEDYSDRLEEYAIEKRLCAEKGLPPPPEPIEKDKAQIELKLKKLEEKGYYQKHRWIQPGEYATEIKRMVQANKESNAPENRDLERLKLLQIARDPMIQAFAQIMEDIVRRLRFADLNSETATKIEKSLEAEQKRKEALQIIDRNREKLISLLGTDLEKQKEFKKVIDSLEQALKVGAESEIISLGKHVKEVFDVLKTINDF